MQTLEADVVIFGYGKITKQITDTLVNKDLKIICVTNYSYNDTNNYEPRIFKKLSYFDILESNIVSNSTIFSWRDSSRLLNGDGVLLKWFSSDSYQSKKSYLLSSASVYMDKSESQDESVQNLDLEVNNNNKFILEKTLTNLMKYKNIKHSNLRISNVYGIDLYYGLIGSLFESVKYNNKVNIFQNTNIIRDYIHLADVVYAIEKLIEIDINEDCVNVSTGVGTSISRVLEIFASKGYKFENYNVLLNDYKVKTVSILDCKKLSKLINWQPSNLLQVLNNLLPIK